MRGPGEKTRNGLIHRKAIVAYNTTLPYQSVSVIINVRLSPLWPRTSSSQR